jgi:multiple sugar transport system substrate-binding protein
VTQRKLTRRSFLKVSGASLAGTALFGAAGCGGGGGQGGKTTLSWWDYFTTGANDVAMEARHKRYMKANPNITIKRRTIPFDQLKPTLLRAAAAGELPDIAVIDNPDHQSFAEQGVVMDITEQVGSWGQEDAYFDGPWISTTWQDKNYGIPDNSNCLVLWYNKEFTEAAGVEPPRTWDELNEAARKLTAGGRFGLAVSAIKSEEGTFQWLPFLWQSGEDIPTIDSAGGRAALQLWVDMVSEGSMSRGILGWTQEDVKNQFQNRRAAMMINGPWQIPLLEADAPDLNWDIVVLPKGNQSASILGGENMSITSGSQYADDAWDLLAWTQKPKELKKYLIQAGKLPSRTDLADESEWANDPVLNVFIEQLKVAKPRAYGPKYPEISTAIQEAIQAAISGESDVGAALSRAQQEISPLLPGEMKQ